MGQVKKAPEVIDMKHFFKFAVVLFFAFFLIRPAGAVSISYTLDFDEDNNSGQYNYTISNDSDLSLDGFRIYFDYENYKDLLLDDSVLNPGWTISIPPHDEQIIGTPYQYPWEITGGWDVSLGKWSDLLEFSVFFNWLGEGMPGAQEFVAFYYDPENCDPWFPDICLVQWPSSGSEDGKYYTDLNDTSTVPEPQTFMLLGTGILALAAYHRRSRSRKKM